MSITDTIAPPKVFIVGGGFAGIAAAKALADAPVDRRLIDRLITGDASIEVEVGPAEFVPDEAPAPVEQRDVLAGSSSLGGDSADTTAIRR